MYLNNILIYDEECYPNIWTNLFFDVKTGEWFFFEVSDRVNQIEEFRNAMRHWSFHKYSQVGFNNIGYDYPVAHAIMTDLTITCAADIFAVSKRIIDTPWNDRFRNRIQPYKWIVHQIDLFLVHHFDNQEKSTNLKMLEFVMRLTNIQDLPFEPETVLTHAQMDTLIEYQYHDVKATHQFYEHSLPALEFRNTLSEKYNKDFMNMNDGKIGEAYFIMGLEKAGVQRYNGREKKQTFREYIDINDIIFPYIKFDHPEFNRVLNQMRTERIYETKGANSWSAVIDGFSYDIGLGGIHASIKGAVIEADDEYNIKDLDFASWYPHLSFNHNLYPEHLTPIFCKVYKELYLERKTHPKGSDLNKALKLALNVAYGNSNSIYSVFYDPKFTMSITINGQLILCMLADQLIKIPNLTMIQCNTDGLTIKYPRIYEEQVLAIWKWIEQVTGIELEGVDYSKMIIRDVNNYLAIYTNGDEKHVGAYTYDTTNRVSGLDWHQNHSALVVTKAACAALIHGRNVREFIMNHDDIYDFFLCTKVARNCSLELQNAHFWGDRMVVPNRTIDVLQNITRYYVSNTGDKLIKKMPPLKRKTQKLNMVYVGWQSKKINGVNKNLQVTSVHEYNSAIKAGYKIKDGGTFTHSKIRESGIDKDWFVTPCNTITDDMKYDINYEYYITEAEKLVNAVL